MDLGENLLPSKNEYAWMLLKKKSTVRVFTTREITCNFIDESHLI
jgi:hypothetical protein